MDENEPQKEGPKEAQKVWEAAVTEVLKDAEDVAGRAGCGPAQALLAMMLLEISGLRQGLEEGILLRVMTGRLPPPEGEEGEEWKK